MQQKTFLVITSIASPNKALKAYAEGCKQNNTCFITIGDAASPNDFFLEGCDFYHLGAQRELPFTFSKNVPEKRYSRKNIGYLLAISQGAEVIIETDDDNLPRKEFWEERKLLQNVNLFTDNGWLNVYKYFAENKNIWPRGFALEELGNQNPLLQDAPFVNDCICPIQQGLADDAPDVDAIYRLTNADELNFAFEKRTDLAIGTNSWCPFNSQNTTWFRPAFPLLYLPSYCSFRMTDIWRSFIAQRISWTCGWNVLFHNATVWQERNEHNLLKDFEDEIPGYLNNGKICKMLSALELLPGEENIYTNLRSCYQLMVKNNWIDEKELLLLDNWIEDLNAIGF
jgi:hypothetical protein